MSMEAIAVDQKLVQSLVSQIKGNVTGEQLADEAQALTELLVDLIQTEEVVVGPNTVTMLQVQIAHIDEELSELLNEILHDKDFQKLESTWRGLHSLVKNTETGPGLKLRVMHATQQELQEDLEKAVDFDQSALFKKVYEEEYGTFGGHPFSLLIGDYEFTHKPKDVALLTNLSNVAAAAHAPFIAAASPELFGLKDNDFTALDVPRDLAMRFEASDMIKWRSFRETEDSRYVTLVLPRVLMRLPYGKATVPVDGFIFEEDLSVDGNGGDGAKAHGKYLWGNAAWKLGERITHAFSLYGWCAAIRGFEGGGTVSDLPLHVFTTDSGEDAVKIPTELAITDRREKELNDLGFLALVYRKGDDKAVFFGSQTTNKPTKYASLDATANAQVSSMLPYLLAASRFAHYIKAMMRDKVGSFMTRGNVASFLNNWISDYVQLNDEASQDIKARQPLREARIDVTEVPGKVGSYKAIVYLKPHFQLNELNASIRLVASLPPPAA
ncbi:type VI secretion system contractile sheath large subunit [Corallococcus exiguus]|uniref:type VI secretion system contractile sheath large subunit n=1 Tax=Corallococcus exiguus TaxID=83462 RepID=UPI00147118EF|nr:type VI secretion system contractile sheath large subunit [Corallococcus exiguus]NNB90241.1 type VI secretion system contractile sheath large subunit [Corallococcus exiguus]